MSQQQTPDEMLPPQNVDAERDFLGAMLIDPDVLLTCGDRLSPADFYRDAHRVIWQAALALRTRHVEVDLTTLPEELIRMGKLDEIGGVSYLTALPNNVPNAGNAEHYADIIRECAVLRDVATVSTHAFQQAYARENAAELIANVQAQLRGIAKRGQPDAFVPFSVAMDELMDDVLARFEQAEGTGLRTGFRALDRHITSLEPGELVYLCGVPGSGKSTFAHCIIGNVALECEARGEGSVAWATLEMRKTQVAKRILSARAGVDGRRIRAGFRQVDGSTDYASYTRFRTAWDELRAPLARRLLVCDTGLTMKQLRTHLTRAVAERECKLAVVDYIGLMVPEDRRQMEYQRISDMSRDLKQIAGDLGIVVVCLVQMSRKHEERANKRPVLNDLRDSGGLGQDADWVWGLYRGATYERGRAAHDERFRRFVELGIVKAREGVAEGAWVPLRAELEYSRFVDWPEGVDWPVDTTRDPAPDSREGEERLDA